jgi:hypothetical protein
MGTFWYLRFCQFSDPLELQHLTFPKPQKLISSCLCLLEYTYKISLWSDEYFLSYRSELNFDVNCSSGHAPWPFELLKKFLQAIILTNYISQRFLTEIMRKSWKRRDRQQQRRRRRRRQTPRPISYAANGLMVHGTELMLPNSKIPFCEHLVYLNNPI